MNERLESLDKECVEYGFKLYFEKMLKINKRAALRFILLTSSEETPRLSSDEVAEQSDLQIIDHCEYITQNVFDKLKLEYYQVEGFLSFVVLIFKKIILIRIDNEDIRKNYSEIQYSIKWLNTIIEYYGGSFQELEDTKKFLLKKSEHLYDKLQDEENHLSNREVSKEDKINNHDSLGLENNESNKTLTIKINDVAIREKVYRELVSFINDDLEKVSLSKALKGEEILGYIRIKKHASSIIDLFLHYHTKKQIAVVSDSDLINWLFEYLMYWDTKEKIYKSITKDNSKQYFSDQRDVSPKNILWK